MDVLWRAMRSLRVWTAFVIALALISAALAASAYGWHLEAQRLQTFTMCPVRTDGADCLEPRLVTVVASTETRSSRSVTVRHEDGRTQALDVFADYGLVRSLAPGQVIDALVWSGDVAVLLNARDRTILFTSLSPEAKAHDALISALGPALFAALVGFVIVEARRDRRARALVASGRLRGSYVLPRRVRTSGIALPMLLTLGIALLVVAVDPLGDPLRPFTPTVRSLPLAAAYGGLIAWSAWSYQRCGIELRDDAIAGPSVRGEITYLDIAEVDVVQRQRSVELMLTLRGGGETSSIPLESFAWFDQIVLLDVLRTRARLARFSPDAERMLAGEPLRRGGDFLRLMSWRAVRIADRAPLSEWVLSAACLGMTMLFIVGGIVMVSSGSLLAGGFVLLVGSGFAGLGSLGLAQWLYRRGLERQLARVGRTARGRVVDIAGVGVTDIGPSYSVLRYEFTPEDGRPRLNLAFDQTPIVRRFSVGDEVLVRFDPTDVRRSMLASAAPLRPKEA